MVVTSGGAARRRSPARLAAGRRSSTSSPAGRAARSRSRPGFVALDRHGADETGRRPRPRRAPGRSSSRRLVGAVAEATARHGAAIPVVPVAETLKRIDGDLVGATVDRDRPGAAQTPQGVRRDLLREAWRRFPADGPETFTDEAALLEACSIAVHVVPGDPGNLKVTLPGRSRRAALALAARARPRDADGYRPRQPSVRAGHAARGWAGSRSRARRGWPATPTATSALHAVADALLGAAGLGDLGRLFPADARTPAASPARELARRGPAAGRGRRLAAGRRST